MLITTSATLWISLIVIIIVAFLVPPALWTHDSDSSKSFRVSVRIDKNGLPTLFEAHLRKGSFRNFVFRTLRITGMRVTVLSLHTVADGACPAPGTATPKGWTHPVFWSPSTTPRCWARGRARSVRRH